MNNIFVFHAYWSSFTDTVEPIFYVHLHLCDQAFIHSCLCLSPALVPVVILSHLYILPFIFPFIFPHLSFCAIPPVLCCNDILQRNTADFDLRFVSFYWLSSSLFIRLCRSWNLSLSPYTVRKLEERITRSQCNTSTSLSSTWALLLSSYHIFNSVCWSHAQVSGPILKMPASDGGLRPIGLYRENTIAIESEASDSLTYISKQICMYVRNVICIVTYTSPLKTNTLLPFGSQNSFWITRSQRCRRRNKGLCSSQLLMMWAAVCSGSPHSHTGLSASPHFFMDDL